MSSPPPRFPRTTAQHRTVAPSSGRRLTLSIVEMAVLTGVVLRLFRALVLTHGPAGSLIYLGGMFAMGAVAFFGMATLHLSNYTVRRWLWRVPAFALIESAAEMATSALLIALHREPLGTSRAEFADWGRMAAGVVLLRVAALILFGLVLAGVVQLVRHLMARRGMAGVTVEDDEPEGVDDVEGSGQGWKADAPR